MRSMLNMKFKRLSKKMVGEEEFWRRYFKEIVKTYDKRSIIATSRSMLDFAYNYKFDYDYLNNWQGKVLILEADDDTSFSDKQKKLLKLLYEDATVHSEHGFGHLTTFIKRNLYIGLISDFIAEG